MEAVYYKDASLGYCPVKKYLEQYADDGNSKAKERGRKYNILTNIDAKINYALEVSGRPKPPILCPLRGYSYFEIKHRKDKNVLIRIFYLRYKDKIVLLSALEKSDNYDTDRERREVERHLKITEDYKNKFNLNPTLYEKYE